MGFLSVVSYAASVVSTGSSTSPPTYLTGYTPTPWYRFSLRTIVLITLPCLSLLGAFGTWTLGSTNGMFKSIMALIASDQPRFPGTDAMLVKNYTWIKPLDSQFAVLVTFFSPVVDNSNGALTLFSVFGSGQFGAAWTLMMMESKRMGNMRKAVGLMWVVGILVQNISFTVTVPLWLLLHLLISPVAKPFPGTHANSVLLVSSWDLRILPLSITLGYIVPSILMVLPSPEMVSPLMHQNFIAFWQPFPVWTCLIHWSLKKGFQSAMNKFASKDTNKTPIPLGASYLSNAKHTYRFVIALCMITHIPVMIVTLLPSWAIPESIPAIAKLASNNLSTVFVPYVPFPSHQVSSLAEGVLNFLQWDVFVGSAALLIWAVLLYRNATTEKMIVDPNTSLPIYRELLLGEKLQDGMLWRKLVWKMWVWFVLAGPTGAVAMMLWERDAIVRQKIKQGI